MYGIINQSISGLVKRDFGQQKWDEICDKANIIQKEFYNEITYDDKLTYDLAIATSEVLGVELFEVLRLFGIYWVTEVAVKKYESLMNMGGSQLHEFLLNMPRFHSRVAMIYPEVTPPEFVVERPAENTYLLHYHSTRQGLSGLMYGMVQGLIMHFKVQADIRIVQTRADGHSDHDIFEISVHG